MVQKHPGGPPKLRHDLPAGVAVLRPAWIFRICQNVLFTAAKSDCFPEGPCSIGIERDASLGKPLRQRGYRFHLLRPGQHPSFELEVVEAISCLRGLGEAQHGRGGKRLFVAQAQPRVGGVWFARVGKVCLAPVTYEE
jgi:hypothetical protein